MHGILNPFTTGNPFLGTQLLAFSIGRGSGALKGLSGQRPDIWFVAPGEGFAPENLPPRTGVHWPRNINKVSSVGRDSLLDCFQVAFALNIFSL